MNKKSALILFVVFGFILTALMIRDGRLLLLAMPFMVYLIIGMIQAPTEIRLVATRFIEKPSVLSEDLFETRVVIEDRGPRLVNLCLNDSLFPGMAIVDGKAHNRLSLQNGESTELKYVCRAARSVYTWNNIHASASDPCGLFELDQEIPASGEILVRPTPIHIRHNPIKPRSTLDAAGPILARQAGPGTDFFGVREFRPGDSLRRINWRLGARHPGQLYTNEFEREEIADFGLILDARRITDDDSTEKALFEFCVSAAASLSEVLLKDGHRVSLLIFGESMSALFPGYGKRQLNFVLRNLARARLGANVSLGYLEYFPTRLFPSHSQIVILGSINSADLETFARLRASGYNLLVISPDPVNYIAQTLSPTVIDLLAFRAACIERTLLLRQLLRMGVGVVDWHVDKPLETSIHQIASHLLHVRNM